LVCFLFNFEQLKVKQMAVVNFTDSLVSYSEFLMPFAITLTHNYEDARDLFQETLYKALANEEKYNSGTNLKAWLYTIMRNIFINNYRKKNKQQVVFDGTPGDYYINSTKAITFNTAVTSINTKEIQKLVLNLPEAFKNPFLLYFDGYKYNEIADMLSEPIGTIKSRIHFARKLLKTQIERF
jgi:RNA polymerase sigma factor (sigma-70 family)